MLSRVMIGTMRMQLLNLPTTIQKRVESKSEKQDGRQISAKIGLA